MNTIEAMHHYVEMITKLDEHNMHEERDLVRAEFKKLFQETPSKEEE